MADNEKFIVYSATNKINGKIYIGKTTKSLIRRRSVHESSALKGSNKYFHKAIRKHGAENFDWKIIEHADNEKELAIKEIFWIQQTGSFGYGYNQTIGGEGVAGFKQSEKCRQWNRENKKGNQNMKGKHHSEETRKKISVMQLGRIPWNKGRTCSAEERLKMSERFRGRVGSNKGKKFSEEHRKNLSLAHAVQHG